MFSTTTEIHQSTLLVTNRTPTPPTPTGKPKCSCKQPKNKSSHCGPKVPREKLDRRSKTHKKVTKSDNILILDPVEKAVKLDDVAVPDPDQKAVLSEHDNYEPSAKKHKKIKFIIQSSLLEPSHTSNCIVNLHVESSKKESAIVWTNNPSHSTPVGINTHSPCSIPAVDDLKHSNCNNQFLFNDFMPEVPFTLPKEKHHLDDEVKPVRSPLVDSHGADVGGTTMNSEGVSQVHQSSVSFTSAVGNVIPTAGVGQDLSQE
jgi:hypothetical protein